MQTKKIFLIVYFGYGVLSTWLANIFNIPWFKKIEHPWPSPAKIKKETGFQVVCVRGVAGTQERKVKFKTEKL